MGTAAGTAVPTGSSARDRAGRLDLVELWAIGQYVDRMVQETLRRQGTSGALLAVLAALARGPRTTSELAASLGQAFMTTSDQLGRLERLGEIRRVPNPRDARSRSIELTPAGHRRLRAAGPHIRRIETTIAVQLGARRVAVTRAAAELRRAVERAANELEVTG